MNYLLVHVNQKNYVAIEVAFATGGRTYLYKAEASDNWKVGDHAVVLVKDKVPAEQLNIVRVVLVHENPLDILAPEMAYKWVIQKVDMTRMAMRETQQDQMIQHLRRWEVQRQALELVETQKRMVAALPNGDKMFEEFARLGAPETEVTQ